MSTKGIPTERKRKYDYKNIDLGTGDKYVDRLAKEIGRLNREIKNLKVYNMLLEFENETLRNAEK